MIFDDSIQDANARNEYERRRSELAKLIHDANQLVIGVLMDLKDGVGVKQPPHPVTFLLARHVVEYVDGIGVLVDKGCAEPCKPLLRSVLEAVMGIQYVLKDDSDRRNIAYQVAHAHKQIKFYRKHDPNTEQGKRFAEEMAQDEFWKSMPPLPIDLPKAVERLESLLKREEFASVEAEWQATKQRNPRRREDPHWHALYNGPTSVRDLAKTLNMLGYYEFLYRYWSDAVHAGGVMTQIKGIKAGAGEKMSQMIIPLRNPQALQNCAQIAIGLCLDVGLAMLEKYAPDEKLKFADRYLNDVQKRYMGMMAHGPLIKLPW